MLEPQVGALYRVTNFKLTTHNFNENDIVEFTGAMYSSEHYKFSWKSGNRGFIFATQYLLKHQFEPISLAQPTREDIIKHLQL